MIEKKEKIYFKLSWDWNNLDWKDGFLWGLSIGLLTLFFVVVI